MRTRWRLAGVVAGVLLVTGACGGGGASPATDAATATTFTADRAVVAALQTMVTAASNASLFAAAGVGTGPATDCANSWATIHDKVAQRDANLASTIDAAVAQLQTATRSRDAVGATAATATITEAAANYTRQFP